MAFEDKHRDVLHQYADRFGVPNVSDDHSRGWTLRLAEQFAFSFADEGWGTKKAGPTNPQSTDALARHLNGRLVGYDLVTAGGGPSAAINYHPEELDISSQVFIAVTAKDHLSGGIPTHQTRLGVSNFPLMAGLRSWRSDALANLDWLRDELSPDVVRILASVIGGPWVEAAVDHNWPDYLDRYREMQDVLNARGMKPLVTVFGGPVNVDEGKRVIDRLIGASNLAQIDSFEICNEWQVNGWPRHDVRELGRHLRSRIPADFPMALSSPHLAHNADGSTTDQQMRDDIDGLYSGVPASLMTVHLLRDQNNRWSVPASYNPLSNLRKYNSEPRGPGASAGGDVSDVNALAGDYHRTIDAGWGLYLLHTRWGVFNGRLDTNQWPQYRERNIWDHNNIQAICNELRTIRRTGSGGGGGGGGGGGPVMFDLPPNDFVLGAIAFTRRFITDRVPVEQFADIHIAVWVFGNGEPLGYVRSYMTGMHAGDAPGVRHANLLHRLNERMETFYGLRV